ncbi:membrane protein [Pandoraea eparura]|jgi:L-lactate dehydrogenase complex protein LldG|uniref:Membrane protein n=1 Tax=Pandoraea eparura TaxID=2508291 RepID=A0A5E4S3M9_9BURK|nr:lactate utilization protein C [Pandoraea eparura]VVD68708.1 membrane protein [Pandoraea eparura]
MDTSDARKRIFARIRHAQHRPDAARANELAAAEDYLARHPQGPRPAMSADLIATFIDKAQALSTTIARVPGMTDVPSAAATYLQANGLTVQAVAWPTLRELDWVGAGCRVEFRKPQGDDLVGITGCFCAIAETGALMMMSGPETFASATLLPETHIAVVPASRIVAGHEDGFALMRSERGQLARATNFIAGPSRTADIEQTLVLGAHGPYRVHLIIVDGV